MLVKITCPDCGPVTVRPNVFSGERPIAGKCPKCRDQLYFDSDEKPPVFTHCNVCGVPLRTKDEFDMGMCLPCAEE